MHIGRRTDQLDFLRFGRLHAVKAVREFVLDISGRDIARAEPLFVDDGRDEGHVVLDAFNMEPVQRLSMHVERGVAILAVRDQLGDHRVIIHGDFVALADAGIHTDFTASQRAF